MAATEMRVVGVLQDYRIKADIAASRAWKWKEMGQESDTDTQSHLTPSSTSTPVTVSSSSSLAPAATHASSSSPVIVKHLRSPLRIGRVISVRLDVAPLKPEFRPPDHDAVVIAWLSSSRLPHTVRHVSINGGWQSDLSLASFRFPHHLTTIDMQRWAGDAAFNDCRLHDWKLPDHLTSIHLPAWTHWSDDLSHLYLPSSLTQLHLGTWCGRADQLPTFPSSLQTLHMGDLYNDTIDSIPWSTLTALSSLTLSWKFDQPLEGVRLPHSLTSLRMRGNYNHPIERMQLPPALTELDLSELRHFNQPLEGLKLPAELRILRLARTWSRSFDHLQLPPSLTQLDFGLHFGRSLLEWNPPDSLTSLTMPPRLDLSMIRLPAKLTALSVTYPFRSSTDSPTTTFTRDRLFQLPATLQTLRLGGFLNDEDFTHLTLPHSLTSLHLGQECDVSLDDVVWPPQLTRLTLGECFNQPLINWSPPPSLTQLSLGNEAGAGAWNLPVSQLRLPVNLHCLTFGSDFNQPLSGFQFPSSLRILRFGQKFNQSLSLCAWSPPPTLEELDLGKKWNQACTHLHLPRRLRKLRLSDEFNQPIELNGAKSTLQLPDTLIELRFGRHFNQSLRFLHLPPSLRFLSIPNPHIHPIPDLPPSLPPRLQCLELANEAVFQHSWALVPVLVPHAHSYSLLRQCAVSYLPWVYVPPWSRNCTHDQNKRTNKIKSRNKCIIQ